MKRRKQITLAGFLVLFLTAGVFVLASHLLLQESLLVEMKNLAGAVMSALFTLFFVLFSWGLPGIYFKEKCRNP